MGSVIVKLFAFEFVLVLLLSGLVSASEIAITTNSSDQISPDIYGDIIVWEDYRNEESSDCNSDIYYYNLALEIETNITTDLSPQRFPSIHGVFVAWEDHRDELSDIYVYDVTERSFSTPQKRTDGYRGSWSEGPGTVWCQSWDNLNYGGPDIYNNKIACDYNRYCGFYCGDTEHSTGTVCRGEPAGYGILVGLTEFNHNPLASLSSPAIYGSNTVYTKCTLPTFESDIYMVTIAGSSVLFRRISYSERARYPDIYEHNVVWQDNRDGNWDIFMKNISTNVEYPICTASGNQEMPAIYGNKIVWHHGLEWMGGRWCGGDIYMYDLAVDTDDDGIPNYMDPDRPSPDPAEVAICTNPSVQKNPAIYGDRVVWEDNRNGNWDIYLLDLSPWVEVNNTGGNLAIAPTTEENNVLKRVPDGWVLKVNNTHQNEESHDGYIWWEVEDVTDGIKGWSKYQSISDGTEYLEKGGEELKKKTDKLNTKDDRKPVILQEVTDHRAEFLPDNFPPGLILAIVIKESGGNEFDNEIIAVNNPWEWGRGIMQIDNDKSVGARSKIRWYNSSGASAPDYCRGREGHGCTCDDGICYCEACKHYYTNTIQGIEANIKDGLGVLKDKSIWCTCCYNRSKNAEWDEVEGLYKDKMGGEVIFYSKNEECRKYNSRIRYDSKIEKIKTNNIEISCDDFKVIDTIWRYNSRSIYIPGPNVWECTKSDYLRCVADNLDKIQSTFGYEMPDKNKWNDSLRAVRNSDSIMVKLRSPGHLQACDSDGRMTGLANGEIIEGIPFSSYDAESGTIVIPFSYDSYRYKVVGTDSGTYGLDITSVEDGEATTFTATDIPTSPNAIHQYTIDWDALSQGEEGVTVQVDSDGDGEFEQAFTTDAELSREEFLSATKGILATIDFDPDTLNLKSKGKWATTYIELPEGYDVSNIDVSTMMLNETVPAELHPTKIGDYDSDGIPDLMVKFDRQAVIDILPVGDAVNVTVTGKLYDGTPFEGTDMIRVIDKGKGKKLKI